MIRGEAPGHLDFAPTNDTFPARCVVRENASQTWRREDVLWKEIGHIGAVNGLNVERNNRRSRLGRNGGGVDAVPCNGVAAGSAVVHQEELESGARIDAIANSDSGKTIWI